MVTNLRSYITSSETQKSLRIIKDLVFKRVRVALSALLTWCQEFHHSSAVKILSKIPQLSAKMARF